jgi:hypothetical protein
MKKLKLKIELKKSFWKAQKKITVVFICGKSVFQDKPHDHKYVADDVSFR